MRSKTNSLIFFNNKVIRSKIPKLIFFERKVIYLSGKVSEEKCLHPFSRNSVMKERQNTEPKSPISGPSRSAGGDRFRAPRGQVVEEVLDFKKRKNKTK